ncbi:MAG: site-specific integrase, partial [Cognatishimia sp.]|uniref:site-specific integrase n=1 Tax=Cognatishimia sp. TaxID=2211648 RepID=UPI00405921B1
MISPAASAARDSWLEAEKALKGNAENTLKAYFADVTEFLAFMTEHKGAQQGLAPLAKITVSDMRAWMARMRSGDVGARTLARKLSAVKGFFRWLAEREGFDPTAVLTTRAPKFQKKLPRPLAADAAKAVIETVDLQTREDWQGARDIAVVTLLYGCGLRISEALGLNVEDHPLPEVLRILGKGSKERLVPVIPA